MVIHKVLHFFLDVNEKKYLITAHHVVQNINSQDIIKIFHDSDYKPVTIRVVGLGDCEKIGKDVAVLALEQRVAPDYPLPTSRGTLTAGQHVKFLGFPHGLGTETIINNGYPIPIIKGAILAGSIPSEERELGLWLLDGNGIPGFSGGPAIYTGLNEPMDSFSVFGIISAHNTVKKIVELDGKFVKKGFYTGLIECTPIQRALEFIEKNPIGFDLKG